MGKFFGLRGNILNWAISTIAGCDFLLFGYGMALVCFSPIRLLMARANMAL